MSVLTWLRQRFQPYYKEVPKDLAEFRKKEEERLKRMQLEPTVEKKLTDVPVVTKEFNAKLLANTNDEKIDRINEIRRNEREMDAVNEKFAGAIVDVKMANKPMDAILKMPASDKTRPDFDVVWFYHDSIRHQVLGHFKPLSGSRATSDERSNSDRRKLDKYVQIWPKGYDKGKVHRTHLIPFGYIGTENHPALIIGWDGDQNVGVLKNFEEKYKNLSYEIYWFTDVRKRDWGAIYRYIIIDARTNIVVDKMTTQVGSPENPVDFSWSPKLTQRPNNVKPKH